ncbi:hypothetical protein ACIBCN_07745 [Nocardia sp. NPDC051052]|uniref:hypothetical protein n=1 Tax=Nocardia sp. NPDC051052 TaxID=3364322 RepID=UPI0037A4EB0D
MTDSRAAQYWEPGVVSNVVGVEAGSMTARVSCGCGVGASHGAGAAMTDARAALCRDSTVVPNVVGVEGLMDSEAMGGCDVAADCLVLLGERG